ncbi:MAG: hypothetical protein ACI97A_004496 [Planctomycetota bacterium]|jgi:hypothetical protein
MRFIYLSLGLTALLSLFTPAFGQHPGEKIPDDIHIYAEMSSPQTLIAKFIETPLVQAANKSGLLAELTENDGFKKAQNVWAALGQRFQGRAALGIRFGVAGPSIFFATEHGGKKDLQEIAMVIGEFDPEIKITDRGTQKNIRWLNLGKGGILGVDKNYLYWGERPSSLREMSRLQKHESVIEGRRYKSSMREAKDFDFLAIVAVADLLKENPIDKNQFKNAAEIILLRAFADDLAKAKYGYAWGRLGELTKFRVRMVNKEPRVESWDLANRERSPLPAVPNQSGHIHLDRDLASFWSQRLNLVPEAGRPGLAEFSQTMNIFLSGFPFSDLMAKTGSGLDIVVREVPKSSELPDLVLPQFAFLIDAHFAQREQERFMVAYQTAIGVINSDAGEKRREPMLQGSAAVSGVQILTARFLQNPKTGNRGTEYNFTPSIAFSKGKLILSSSKDLAIDLVRSLEAADSTTKNKRRGDRLYLSGGSVARMLSLNRLNLVESRMLDEGEDEDEAETTIDAILEVLGQIDSLRLNHVSLVKSTVWDFAFKMKSSGVNK